MGLLVGDLMELARGEERRDEPEEMRLDALVEEAVERARRHAPAVTFATTLEPCVVAGAPDRISRAVNNLLDNAVRYGGTQIVMSIHDRAEGGAEIGVEDNGPGVADDELPRMFEPFWRGDRADTRNDGGTGLGLAIAREIVERLGGTLVASRGPAGAGMRFTVTLPG